MWSKLKCEIHEGDEVLDEQEKKRAAALMRPQQKCKAKPKCDEEKEARIHPADDQ